MNADGQTLGRFASKAAKLLRGKHKADFTPHVDCGDNVIVINSEKIKMTGRKWTEKEYVSHTGYPGGQRHITPQKLMAKDPTKVVEKAVYGMIPKNKLGNAIKGNLYVYAGNEHPHTAQKPKEINLSSK